MKEQSDTPAIKSFEEFKDSVKLVREASGTGFGSKLNTYQVIKTGYYIHAVSLADAYVYYKSRNLWFDK